MGINNNAYGLGFNAAKAMLFRTEQGKVVSFADNPKIWGEVVAKFVGLIKKQAANDHIDIIFMLKKEVLKEYNTAFLTIFEINRIIRENEHRTDTDIEKLLAGPILAKAAEYANRFDYVTQNTMFLLPDKFDILHYDDSLNDYDKETYAGSIYGQQLLYRMLAQHMLYFINDNTSVRDILSENSDDNIMIYLIQEIIEQGKKVYR